MSDLSIQIQTLGGTNHTFSNEFVKSCNWSYERFGGCGKGSLLLDMPPENTAPAITGCQNVQISVSGSLVYQGRIDNMNAGQNSVNDPRNVYLTIDGYIRAMENLDITEIYENDTVESIVTNIMNSLVIGNSSVGFATANVYATGFTVDKISFNCNCMDAIKKLAELVGGVEYGVDCNRNFYFKQKITTNQNFNFQTNNNMYNFAYTEDSHAIRNVIHLQGGVLTTTGNQVGNGQVFEATYSNAASIASYGRRDIQINNGMIMTATVGNKWATNMFPTIAEPKKTASFNHDKLAVPFEALATPLRMVTVQGVGLDATSFDVAAINYTWDVSASSGVNAAFTLGQYRSYNAQIQGGGLGVKGGGRGGGGGGGGLVLPPINIPGFNPPERAHDQPAILGIADGCSYVDGYQWTFAGAWNGGKIDFVTVSGLQKTIQDNSNACTTNDCWIDYTTQTIKFPITGYGSSHIVVMGWHPTR